MRDDSGMQDVQYTEVNLLFNPQYSDPQWANSEWWYRHLWYFLSVHWLILKTLLYVEYFSTIFCDSYVKAWVFHFVMLFCCPSNIMLLYLYFCCFCYFYRKIDLTEQSACLGPPTEVPPPTLSYCARYSVARNLLTNTWAQSTVGPAYNEFSYIEQISLREIIDSNVEILVTTNIHFQQAVSFGCFCSL